MNTSSAVGSLPIGTPPVVRRVLETATTAWCALFGDRLVSIVLYQH